MLMEYMLTFSKSYPGADVQYFDSHSKAVKSAINQHKTLGFVPEAIYKYNPETGKYDKLAGKFNISERS